MSRRKNYAEVYSKYKPQVDFSAYVDYYPDLQNAWKMIDTRIQGGDMSQFESAHGLTPEGQADYWIKRGAKDKASFGRAHAAEDNALKVGKYMGATKYKKGSPEWEEVFGGDTRYSSFLTKDSETTAGTTAGTTATDSGRANPIVYPGPDQRENLSFQAQDWSRFMTPAGTGMWDSGVDLGENQGLLFQRYTPEFTETYGGTTPYHYPDAPYLGSSHGSSGNRFRFDDFDPDRNGRKSSSNNNNNTGTQGGHSVVVDGEYIETGSSFITADGTVMQAPPGTVPVNKDGYLISSKAIKEGAEIAGWLHGDPTMVNLPAVPANKDISDFLSKVGKESKAIHGKGGYYMGISTRAMPGKRSKDKETGKYVPGVKSPSDD